MDDSNVRDIPAEVGVLRVMLSYNSRGQRYTYAGLTRAKIYLYEHTEDRPIIRCDSVIRGRELEVNGASVFVLDSFAIDQNTKVFDAVPAGSRWTIAGVAYGASETPLAFGCLDDQIIAGGEQQEINIDLTDFSLKYRGMYTVRHTLDLREGLMLAGVRVNDEGVLIGDEHHCDGEHPELCRLYTALSFLQTIGSQSVGADRALNDLFCELVDLDGTICTLISTFVTSTLRSEDSLTSTLGPRGSLRGLGVVLSPELLLVGSGPSAGPSHSSS